MTNAMQVLNGTSSARFSLSVENNSPRFQTTLGGIAVDLNEARLVLSRVFSFWDSERST